MRCPCGRSTGRITTCSCGARFRVVKNGDVGSQREVVSGPRSRGYVVKNGRLERVVKKGSE